MSAHGYSPRPKLEKPTILPVASMPYSNKCTWVEGNPGNWTRCDAVVCKVGGSWCQTHQDIVYHLHICGIGTSRMPDVDWEKVELDYRAGVLSINNICASHGVSRHRLMEKVASGAWVRDLMSQVRAEVNERLYMNRLVEERSQDHVSAAAQVIVDAVAGHRADILALRTTFNRVLAQVNTILDLGEQDIDDADVAMDILKTVRGSMLFGKTKGVVASLDTLASAYQRIVAMERQAYGMESLVPLAPEAGGEAGQQVASVQVYLPANHREPVG